MLTNSVIEVTNLRKAYRSTAAIDDVSFQVYDGEIFGLLGPNGAGKTTTRMSTGLTPSGFRYNQSPRT